MDALAFRMGLLTAIKSKLAGGLAAGLMITASHNPAPDNGVKIVETDGKMIAEQWESYATDLANMEHDQILDYLIKLCPQDADSLVYLGRDTRDSSQRLANAAIEGIKCLTGSYVDFGLLTTPQLHLIVKAKNEGGMEPTEEGYYGKLSAAFHGLVSLGDISDASDSRYKPHVFLDCANGVGGPKMVKFITRLQHLIVHLYNTGDGVVNQNCGSDYVLTKQATPANCPVEVGQRWISFDGDADRIIYFYKTTTGECNVLNGDKIACLCAIYVKELLEQSEALKALNTSIVQTAYSNSMSTKFAQSLGISVHCVATGVKNLIRQAEKSDVGILFESNGHGSIAFSSKAIQTIRSEVAKGNLAAKKLQYIYELLNQATGDAISDMLLVEFILRVKNWTIEDWDAIYKEIPYSQLTVSVPDRYFITTNHNATVCLKPEGLQQEIEKLYSGFQDGVRAFVRPSGTEDIVRVYAEAFSSQDAVKLANQVKDLVLKYAHA